MKLSKIIIKIIKESKCLLTAADIIKLMFTKYENQLDLENIPKKKYSSIWFVGGQGPLNVNQGENVKEAVVRMKNLGFNIYKVNIKCDDLILNELDEYEQQFSLVNITYNNIIYIINDITDDNRDSFYKYPRFKKMRDINNKYYYYYDRTW